MSKIIFRTRLASSIACCCRSRSDPGVDTLLGGVLGTDRPVCITSSVTRSRPSRLYACRSTSPMSPANPTSLFRKMTSSRSQFMAGTSCLMVAPFGNLYNMRKANNCVDMSALALDASWMMCSPKSWTMIRFSASTTQSRPKSDAVDGIDRSPGALAEQATHGKCGEQLFLDTSPDGCSKLSEWFLSRPTELPE